MAQHIQVKSLDRKSGIFQSIEMELSEDLRKKTRMGAIMLRMIQAFSKNIYLIELTNQLVFSEIELPEGRVFISGDGSVWRGNDAIGICFLLTPEPRGTSSTHRMIIFTLAKPLEAQA